MKKRGKSRRAAKSPGKSLQVAPGRADRAAPTPSYPLPSASEQFASLLNRAEERLPEILSKVADPRRELERKTFALRIAFLRRLMEARGELSGNLALEACRLGRDLQRAELLFWANLGAKVSHRNPHWRTLVFLHRLGDKEAWAELKRQDAELEKIGSRILAFQEAKAKNPTWKNQVNAEIASEELYGTPRSSRTILDACRRFDPGLLADSKISHK